MDKEIFENFRENIEAADFENGIPEEYKNIPAETVEKLLADKKTITAAESVTAGLFQATIADVPHASDTFEGGYITYSDAMKEKMLSIPSKVINIHTVVSAPVAQQMAESTAVILGKDIGVGITGVAGPDPLEGSPVGTVFIGVYTKSENVVQVKEFHFEGSRNAVREKAVISAFVLVSKIA
ncbi:nicotinamide-nucleotide amidohydrolase family protein [Companilactobacillus ginsenosidimutans]|uniref:nicotinamide-nucleotide amidohydrolase family protein n=1 Tax=Companilactobacillus ginsenosidimutans TaxID=1007676 RepID=UPI00069D3B57|nr:nicotinamide-nucleotide amidohydrolase family protein [Companilactobacillus ginsenosidimutans]